MAVPCPRALTARAPSGGSSQGLHRTGTLGMALFAAGLHKHDAS